MTNQAAVFACIDPVYAHWQLGPLPPAERRLLLLGWRLPVRAVDSGVPDVVQAILARAITSIARVSFPVSEHDPAANMEKADVRVLSCRSLAERADAALKGEPPSVTLVTTRDAATAARLFDDPGYPWHLQGQVALLSSLNSAPPDIDRKTLFSLFSEHWTRHGAQLRCDGVDAVMRPGVDGDIVGVLSLTDAFTSALLGALEHEASEAEFDWFVLAEDEFASMLATA